MRRPVSTPRPLSTMEDRCGAVAGGVVEFSSLPATPENTDPAPGQNADGVRMVTAASAGPTVDGSRPRRRVPRVVGEGREGLTQALVAGPAEADPAVLARRVGDRCDAGLSGELLFGGEPGAIVAPLDEDLGGGDASGAREGHDDGAGGGLGHGAVVCAV